MDRKKDRLGSVGWEKVVYLLDWVVIRLIIQPGVGINKQEIIWFSKQNKVCFSSINQ